MRPDDDAEAELLAALREMYEAEETWERARDRMAAAYDRARGIADGDPPTRPIPAPKRPQNDPTPISEGE